jgi:hypothetical protein
MKKVLGLSLLLCVPGFSSIAFTGSGGVIPDDGSTSFTSDITPGAGFGNVAPGDSITVGLIGLQHTYAGDLSATLTYLDAFNFPQLTIFLFFRILDPGTPGGCPCQFGDGLGSGDNYFFNGIFSGDIWTVAATGPLGSADPIPGGNYFPTGVGSGTNTGLSQFAGFPIDGTWRLTIFDQSTGDSGQLVEWSLEIVSTIPEPDLRIATALIVTGFLIVFRLRQRRRFPSSDRRAE